MKKTLKNLIKHRWAYIFLAPWLFFFFIFVFVPFVIGITYAFFDYNFVTMKFVGFRNFAYILSDNIFLRSIGNTVKIAVIVVMLTISVSLLLSVIIIRQAKRFQSLSKIAIYIPAVTSSVAIVAIWRWTFSPALGISATICAKLGITAIDWFGQPTNALSLVSLMVLAFTLGQPVVLYTAAMIAVPKTYFEAALIDGASEVRQFFSIMLPMISPTTLYITVTSTIGIMQVFEVPLLLTSGGPQYSTTTIMLMLYRTAFDSARFGRAAAMGIVLFVMIGILGIIQFRTMKSDIKY